MSKITRLRLQNFTAFAELDQEFSPGVNVIIGANGTGKTHLLKVLYAACAITSGEDKDNKSFALKLRNIFSPYEGNMGRLAHRKQGGVTVKAEITRQSDKRLSVEFTNQSKNPESVTVTRENSWKKHTLESVYIPVKEMLAHAPGFLATVAKREIAFEEIYVDIIRHAYLPILKGPVDKNRRVLLEALQNAISGKVITKGEHFFLKNKQGDLEFTLLAEGIRKLALIWLLIQNGTLRAGSILFWDEPEANLNPQLMGAVVEVILKLQRIDVQVFITTHNYVLLKEFDLRQKNNDQIRYLSLFREEGKLMAKSSTSYTGIEPNAIADTFSDLYDRQIDRSLGNIK